MVENQIDQRAEAIKAAEALANHESETGEVLPLEQVGQHDTLDKGNEDIVIMPAPADFPGTIIDPEYTTADQQENSTKLEPSKIPEPEPLCPVCGGKGFIEKQAGQFMIRCEGCKGTGKVIFKTEIEADYVSTSGTGQDNQPTGSADAGKPKKPKAHKTRRKAKAKSK